MRALLPAFARPELEHRLPDRLAVHWFSDAADALAAIPEVEIAWLDLPDRADLAAAVERATSLRWLFTLGAGVEAFDLDLLRRRGVTLTNGSGLTAVAVAEYAVLGMLVAAKRYDDVVRLADRREWTDKPPGRRQLAGSRALIIGLGEIGRRISDRLAGFGVTVMGATRSGREGTIGLDAWRGRLGEFDWVVLAAPSTPATQAMIGPPELAAMRPGAWLVNVGRGDLIDNEALLDALRSGRLGGAFLDPTTPEPLPPEHPLWSERNCLLSMHLAGRSQSDLVARAASLLLENLAAYAAGKPMRNVVDLRAGY